MGGYLNTNQNPFNLHRGVIATNQDEPDPPLRNRLMRLKCFDDGHGAIGAELDADMDVEVLLPGCRRHLPAAPDLPAQVLDVGDHQFV